MNHKRQSIVCLAAVALVLTARAQTNQPVPAPPRLSVLATNAQSLIPVVQSPVTYFRQLLMMSPAERNQSLADRAPEARARILAKIREYKGLNPDERELRLRATEMRWYLAPLMHLAATNRAGLLARVPPEMLDLVQSRLMQWDALPPTLQAEFLANEQTWHYLMQTPASSVTNAQPDSLAEQFSQFFVLTPREKERLLDTLSETERVQMEKTLQTFEQMPMPQRARCIRNYAKFAGMSAAERTEFLKNAESWSKMSPAERQTWRDLVATVPLLPPMRTPAPPPLPPNLRPKPVKTGVATN